MIKANLVASELKSAGFDTKGIRYNRVDVSLRSRVVSIAEVETALAQLFNGVKFNLIRTSVDVAVNW